MAWPLSPLGTTVELWLGSALGWTDITNWVRLESAASGGGIAITYGRSAEGQDTEATKCNLVLDNRDGRFSPRNPDSPYYGLLGRNTPLRVRVTEAGGTKVLAVSGHDMAEISATMNAPADASYAISGDIDVRIDAAVPNGWRADAVPPAESIMLCGHFVAATPQRGWTLAVDREGHLEVTYSSDGTLATRVTYQSTAVVAPAVGDRLAARVTLEPAAGLIKFYTAPTISGTWTQLGTTLNIGAFTLFSAPNAGLEIGGVHDFSTVPSLAGYVYAFEYRNGVNGTIVAAPNIAGMQSGDRTLTDQFGKVWTLTDFAHIVDQRTRCLTEATAWPSRWDLGEDDKWVPLETSGILRRLSQGSSPRRSPLYRTLLKRNPAGYLPLEDAVEATRPSSAASGITAGTSANITFGSDIKPKGARAAIVFEDNAVVSSQVAYRDATTWAATFFYKYGTLPTTGSYWPFLRCYMEGGTAAYLDFEVGDLSVHLVARDKKGNLLAENGYGYPGGVDPTLTWIGMCVQIRQDPSNVVRIGAVWHPVGSTSFYGTFEGNTFAGTVGRIARVEFRNGDNGTRLTGLGLSHVEVDNDGMPMLSTEFRLSSNGYQGEPAARRIMRLCNEDSIPIACYGMPNQTVLMGPQPESSLVELIREAAKVDGGILAESRGMLGFEYRTRRSLYNQQHLDIPYPYVSAPFEPIEDDDGLVNDMTVTRTDGGSARYVKDSGPLSIAPPPVGVGSYDSSDSVNAANDTDLFNIAGWRVNLGTVNEPRYARITLDLSASRWVADPTRIQQVAQAQLGDALKISSLPAFLPPGDAGAILQGYTEKLDAFDWDLELNATPSSPYTVGVVGTARVGSKGTTLALPLAANGTSANISNTDANGPWTTNAAHFPLDMKVGEERLTASAIGLSVADDFARTTANAWGLSWELFNGAANEYSTDGTVGKINPAVLASDRIAAWKVGGPNQDFTTLIPGIGAAVGGSYTAGLVGRMSDGSNFYRGILTVTTGGAVSAAIWKRVAGTLTSLASTGTLSLNATSGIWVRLQLHGDQIRLRLWQQGALEPVSWTLVATDTSLQGDYIGCLARRETGNTGPLPLQFDNFTAPNPQKVTISARAVNGRAFAWNAGTPADVWQPARIAL